MRLGFIGNKDSKGTSGVYRPEEIIDKLDAEYKVTNYNYDIDFNSLGSSSPAALAFCFSKDGTNLYVLAGATRTTARVCQYVLSTPFKLSTAGYQVGRDLIVGALHTTIYSVYINPSGTRLFFGASGAIYSVTFSTPYNLATARTDVKAFYLGTQDSTPSRLYISPDGVKLYCLGTTTFLIFQYTLATAWDISTASYDNKFFSPTTQDTSPQGLFFKPDGTILYVVGITTDTVYQYNLSTPWDVSTAVYASKSKSISAQEANARAIFITPDGLKLYLIGVTGDDINEYTFGTAWDISTASYVRVSANLTDTTPASLFFNNDGSIAYVLGDGSDLLRQFTLSTPWDVSTLALEKSLDLGWWGGTLTGMFFNTNGTSLFLVGSTNDVLIQLDLETPWQVDSVKGYLWNTARGLTFNDSGTILYLIGNAYVQRYNLATPFELHTATYVNQASQLSTSTGQGLSINDNGTKMLVAFGSGGGWASGFTVGQCSVLLGTMTSPYALETLNFDPKEILSLYGQLGTVAQCYSPYISPDGSMLFVLTNGSAGTGRINRYSLKFS